MGFFFILTVILLLHPGIQTALITLSLWTDDVKFFFKY